MICVERLNGEILYLNWLQVELIEQIPETKIRMMNGDYYLVKDSVESIKDQVTGFFQRCVSIRKRRFCRRILAYKARRAAPQATKA